MFVIPKKDGGWRPIINLKWLNKTFLDAPRFRMDMVRDAAALLRPCNWAASIDLKDVSPASTSKDLKGKGYGRNSRGKGGGQK